ncbi:hypothetical protein CRYUN_Cryun09bG0165700 [Craigia yunnanensis]
MHSSAILSTQLQQHQSSHATSLTQLNPVVEVPLLLALPHSPAGTTPSKLSQHHLQRHSHLLLLSFSSSHARRGLEITARTAGASKTIEAVDGVGMQQKQGLRQGIRYFVLAVSMEMNFGPRISLDLLKLPYRRRQILSILLLAGFTSLNFTFIVLVA